ncbi:Aerobic C4-dicarboxylate transport protein [Peptoniphilus indolicus]|uniref:Aerobic C4-dicarboxylate transport protein n=1 Tax=Peptoniphilus indolicus TaxID=33030 RepID=A0A379DAF8_9FIRM|nr:cation:dicarboxylase symporter family transporter [Peptoniphilus indolicus]SUB74996.1 Aerobic C4-dicarboxylate transport protein [Peptoniphilus indolicus]
MTEKVSKKRDLSLLLLIGGIVLGAIIGLVFGEKATVLKPLGDIFLNLMFTIVAPMVLVSISTAVGNMIDMKRLGKILTWTMLIFVVTGLFAGIVSFGTLNIFNIVDPGSMNFEMAAEQGVEIKSAGDMVVETLTVSDFPEILSRKNMLAIIVFSIMLGLAVSKNGGKDSLVGKLLNNLNNVIMTIISFIMKLAPIGLGAYFAI